MGKAIEEAHSAALYNRLIKTQHAILVSELAKLEHLNSLITAGKEKREREHGKKIEYYKQTQQLL